VILPGYGGWIFSACKVFAEDDDKIFLWAFLQEYYEPEFGLRTYYLNPLGFIPN